MYVANFNNSSETNYLSALGTHHGLLRHSLQCYELLSRKPPHSQRTVATSVIQSLTRVFRNLTFITVSCKLFLISSIN
jgi:hypothetical protein